MDDTVTQYTLTLEERDGYLYARVAADTMTREMALSYLRAVADRCTELECSRVMLERDVPVMLSSGDLFFTTNDFAKMMSGRKVAFINPHLTNESEFDFAVMIANNRGAEFRVFPTLERAESWLLRCVALLIGVNSALNLPTIPLI